LTTKIKLNILNIQYVKNATWNANRKTLNQLSAKKSYFTDDANAYIFICSPREEKDPEVGIAEYKATCDPKSNTRTSMIEYNENLIITSQRVAHELGHNLGMSHDFDLSVDEVTRNRRYSINGKLCTDIGGVMDWSQPNNTQKFKWSDCSVEDFKQYYKYIIHRNGKFCLKQFTFRHQGENVSKTKNAILPCNTSCFQNSIFGIIWYYIKDGERYEILKASSKFQKTRYSKNQERFKNERATVKYSDIDLNLRIENVLESDKGVYQCEVIFSKKNPECREIQETTLSVHASSKYVKEL
jgi:hypothetical protein